MTANRCGVPYKSNGSFLEFDPASGSTASAYETEL